MKVEANGEMEERFSSKDGVMTVDSKKVENAKECRAIVSFGRQQGWDLRSGVGMGYLG